MSEATIRPVSLLSVAAIRGGFQPLGSASRAPATENVSEDEYARGLSDGQQMAEAAFAAEREAFRKLVANAQAFRPETGPELSLLLRETVVRLVEQIAGNVCIDADYLESQIARAAAIITEADDARFILLHPDDAALVGESIASLSVRLDPALQRGMIRITCSEGWIEHGIPLGIERLREVLHIEGAAK